MVGILSWHEITKTIEQRAFHVSRHFCDTFLSLYKINKYFSYFYREATTSSLVTQKKKALKGYLTQKLERVGTALFWQTGGDTPVELLLLYSASTINIAC